MGKFFGCCTSSNAEDKRDADLTTYGGNDTALQGTDTSSSSSKRHSHGHDAMGNEQNKGVGDSAHGTPGYGAAFSDGNQDSQSSHSDDVEMNRDSSHSSGKEGAPLSGSNSSASLTDSGGEDDEAYMCSGGSLSAASSSSDFTQQAVGNSDVTPAKAGSESAHGERKVGKLCLSGQGSDGTPTQPSASPDGSVGLTSVGYSADGTSHAPSTWLSSVGGAQPVKEESASRSVA